MRQGCLILVTSLIWVLQSGLVDGADGADGANGADGSSPWSTNNIDFKVGL
jgi:hypothetical protein